MALGTYGPLFDKAMSNVVEVQARGANVLALTTETHRDAMAARTPTGADGAGRGAYAAALSWGWPLCSCWRTTSPWSGAATSTSPGTWPRASPWSKNRNTPREL